ncbi:hypothetical protein PUN28_015553 [Cardiocondyla obscurior]|uniref:Uncharacterized protein n=1 Tax=Cardiocondyla obscurior TaxID=286306 RepID=A0AAW2EXZ1_9HYME
MAGKTGGLTRVIKSRGDCAKRGRDPHSPGRSGWRARGAYVTLGVYVPSTRNKRKRQGSRECGISRYLSKRWSAGAARGERKREEK